jgi:Kef-type K+ transport system membrane component KefB
MTLSTIEPLLVIATAAVLSPILADLSGPLRVPDVVIQLLLGIVVGPQVLGLARPDSLVNDLSDMGLAFLMFLAGYELNLRRIRGQPLALATIGWWASVLLGLGSSFLLAGFGLVIDPLVVGLAFTTTALGTLLPILRDAAIAETGFGTLILAVGTVGEFFPIVAVAILLDDQHRLRTGVLLGLFVLLAAGTALLAARIRSRHLLRLMRRNLQSSAQLPVRVALLVILVLVVLAFQLGLDVLLGAFAAGIVVRRLVRGQDVETIGSKLEGIGFGFLIPVFFVVSGIRFGLRALVGSPVAILHLPLFFLLLLVVRGLPTLAVYRRHLGMAERQALGLFSATGLPLIVVITTVGLAEQRLVAANAAALVGAGMLSVLVCPLLGLARLRAATPPRARAATPNDPPG